MRLPNCSAVKFAFEVCGSCGMCAVTILLEDFGIKGVTYGFFFSSPYLWYNRGCSVGIHVTCSI